MRKPEQTTEPSIEEILASIRRIIADDGATPPAPVFDRSMPAAGREQAEAQYAGVQNDEFWQHDDFGGHETEARRPAQSEDEILELTEDFMVEEAVAAAARRVMEQAREEPEPAYAAEYAPGYQGYAEDDETSLPIPDAADLDAPGMIAMEAPLTSEGLNSVLSNVVAEMRRLSDGQGLDAAKGFDPYEEEEDEMPAPEPERAAWQPPVRPAQAGPAQRPVWSARHRDGDDAAARNGKAPEAVSREPLPRPVVDAAQSLAVIPEAGPGAPFFAPPAERPGPAATVKNAAAQSQPAAEGPVPPPADAAQAPREKERRAVGDTLTRAFARTPAPEETEATADARGLQGKAAEMAKAAVSDFATEKLSAPPVAHALRADKPFMAEITSSLAGALARKAQQQKAGSEAAEVELPESALAPDAATDAGTAALGAVSEAPAQRAVTAEAPGKQPDEPHGHSEAAAQSTPPAAVKPVQVSPASSAPADETVPAGLPEGLESAVVAMLKPLILQWLNDNLPRLVEKALREEIAANGPLSQRGSKANGARG